MALMTPAPATSVSPEVAAMREALKWPGTWAEAGSVSRRYELESGPQVDYWENFDTLAGPQGQTRAWFDEAGYPSTAPDPGAIAPNPRVMYTVPAEYGEGARDAYDVLETNWARFKEAHGIVPWINTYKTVYVFAYRTRDGKQFGRALVYPQSDDSLFGAIAQIAFAAFASFAFGAISAEVFSAGSGTSVAGVGGQVTTPTFDVTFAESAAVESAAIAPVEIPMDFGFDLADVGAIGDIGDAFPDTDNLFGDAFESFGYTSGESFSVGTDAVEVDYGWGSVPDSFPPYEGEAGLYPASENFYRGEIPAQDWNATPENITNDFGVVNYSWEEGLADAARLGQQVTSVVKTATGLYAATQTRTGQSSGGGASSPLVKSVIGTPQQARPPTMSNVGTQSTAQQIESAQPRSFFGQLGGGSGSEGGGMLGMLALIFGAGLVAYAATR